MQDLLETLIKIRSSPFRSLKRSDFFEDMEGCLAVFYKLEVREIQVVSEGFARIPSAYRTFPEGSLYIESLQKIIHSQ